ncbi:MAG: 16S rRNA (cytidine(1402)-2'-O)-methyltransferase [Acidimicrobiales bacterium]
MSAAGALVLIATPIGNLGDASSRMVAALADLDVLCCEDTRRTRALLSALGVRSGGRLVSLHSRNEEARIGSVLRWLTEGKSVGVVSDAGTPTLSDPGSRLVSAAADAGFTVTSVPGASALLVALSVSGLDTSSFCMEGFLARKGSQRGRQLESIKESERTTVIFESPARLHRLLADLAERCAQRRIAICREMTKLHEEIWRGTVAEALEHFAQREVLGEIVVVVGGSERQDGFEEGAVSLALRDRLAEGDSPSRAAQTVSQALAVPRRRVYELAITLSKGAS